MSIDFGTDHINDRKLHNQLKRVFLGVLMVIALAGCTYSSSEYQRFETKALRDTGDTRLGQGVATLVADEPGNSGFVPLANGLDAFVARLALVEAADKSLDVQYYLFHDDSTGRLLTAYLLRAANRGVRVRLLLDDMDMGGRDAGLSAIVQHPNIQVRLFNPFPIRGMRFLNFITHFGTVTRRMHNKSFTVDNQVTIVGGRNIGDEYFDAAQGVNFGDMDLLSIGPVVRQVSHAFDEYWNSDLTIPASSFDLPSDPEFITRSKSVLNKELASLSESAYGRRLEESKLVEKLEAGSLDVFWAPAHLFYDRPEKVRSEPGDRTAHLGPQLSELFASVENDLILVSPYFVPGKQGTALLKSLVERGCRVTVLTNSLAATDVPAVHGGYARYRTELLESGVEIYEMPPTKNAASHSNRLGASQASLHAKTMVFDQKRVMVGSMNLDPRSNLLNTEMGILVDSSEMAGAVSDWREHSLPEIAWRVELERVEDSVPFGSQQRLRWISLEDGQLIRLEQHEPEAGFWDRVQAAISRLLPIERQL